MRRRLVDFRDSDKDEATKKKMDLRYNAFLRSIWLRFSAVCVYSAYLYVCFFLFLFFSHLSHFLSIFVCSFVNFSVFVCLFVCLGSPTVI